MKAYALTMGLVVLSHVIAVTVFGVRVETAVLAVWFSLIALFTHALVMWSKP